MNYNELRDGQEFYANGYKKGYEEALHLFHEWLKKQSIVGFDYENCDLLIVKDGRWVSAMETYLRKDDYL